MNIVSSSSIGAPADPSEIGRELDRIAEAVIGLDRQREYLDRGYVRLDGLWSPALAQALADEARAKHRLAETPEAYPGPATTRSGNRAPARQVTIGQAPLLSALHVALTRVARMLSAKMVVPTVGTYGYYELDDGCYLHLDTEVADVTFLINVLGRLGPLRMHPELVGADTTELEGLEADPAWDRHSGEPIAAHRVFVLGDRFGQTAWDV